MKENAIACPETIKKRNGTPVPFDVNKIRSAIHKANEAAQIEAIAPVQFEKLVDEVVESIPAGQSPPAAANKHPQQNEIPMSLRFPCVPLVLWTLLPSARNLAVVVTLRLPAASLKAQQNPSCSSCKQQ